MYQLHRVSWTNKGIKENQIMSISVDASSKNNKFAPGHLNTAPEPTNIVFWVSLFPESTVPTVICNSKKVVDVRLVKVGPIPTLQIATKLMKSEEKMACSVISGQKGEKVESE